jgi:hypothetical protein
MEIKIHIDDHLATQLQNTAQRLDCDIDDYVEQILKNRFQPANNLEQRQFIGKLVRDTDLSSDHQLVQVNGIYYRFTITNADVAKRNSYYQIIGNDGNILFLEALNN